MGGKAAIERKESPATPKQSLLFAACLLLLTAGCAESRIPARELSEEDSAAIRMLEEELPGAEEIPVYGRVTAYDRRVSLVFEGSSGEASMMALADFIREEEIPAVFFLPGSVAMEQPELVGYIAEAGIPIGSYGLTGEPRAEENDAPRNLRQLLKAQEAIEAASGQAPGYLRLNLTEYNGELLRLAGLCGLRAAVEPSVYLNHRSFATKRQAAEFIRSVPRGSLIAVKLGQELEESELYAPPILRAGRPEGAGEEKAAPPERNDTDALTLLRWLTAACEAEGWELVPLEELQRAGEEEPPRREVPPELLERLDPALYPALVTPEPFGAPEHAPVEDSFFDGAVFVGDSITALGLKRYTERRRREEPGFLGAAEFLAEGGLSVRNALWQVSGESRHPAYEGRRMPLEDAIALMGADKVYLMLGMNDVPLTDIETFLGNYQTLIRLIRQKSPGAEIYIQSVTPGTKGGEVRPDNGRILQYNLALVEFAARYGYHYVDVAHALRGKDGSLPPELCSDEGGIGFHIKSDACGIWAEYLYTHTR